MTLYIQHVWPVQDLQAVCATQNAVANVPMVLNGTLTNSFIPNQISFINHGFIRGVSITSANNISANTFTILGIQNGASVTENITGPNATTVYGLLSYDVITSVTVNNNSNGVQIGTGDVGFLPLVGVDTLMNTGMLNYAFQVILGATPGITYDVLYSLVKIESTGKSFKDLVPASVLMPFSGNQTTSILEQDYVVTKYFLLNITASTTPVTDTLTFVYIQIQ